MAVPDGGTAKRRSLHPGYELTPVSVIPGRGLLPASPESITTGGNDTESIGVMDSGLAQERAPE